MIKEAEKEFGKYILLGIILILVFISYKIIAPYLIILISAFIFAYLIRPIYIFLNKFLSQSVSASICIFLIIIVFIIPIAMVIANVAMQAYASLDSGALQAVIDNLSSLKILSNLNIDPSYLLSNAGDLLVTLLSSVAKYLPSLIIGAVLFLFATYYLLTEWKSIVEGVSKFIPFADKEKVLRGINHSTHGIIYGYFLIAILEFVVGAIGFYLSGVQYYFLLSFLVAILVFIPGFGAIAVIIPMLVFYVMAGNWYAFTGVLITGAILSFYLEIILTAKILGNKTRVHPLIMLLGILGGTTVFGLFGFIIGPLVLVYTLKILQDLLRRI